MPAVALGRWEIGVDDRADERVDELHRRAVPDDLRPHQRPGNLRGILRSQPREPAYEAELGASAEDRESAGQ
jgi:hypothetical protein